MYEPDNNQTETNFVDPNTDDLDAFNDLLHGKAKVKTEEVEEPAKEEKVTKEEVDTNLGEDETGDSDSNEEDLDEGEESEDEEQKQPTDEKPAKKTNRFQERINELTAQKREAERREAEMLKRLEALESKQTAPEKAEAPAQQEKENNGPTPDDLNDDGSEKYPLGEFDPQYIRDLTRHTIQAEQATLTRKAEQERVQREETQAREALQTEWVGKVTAVSEKHQDFVEKTMELESTFEGLDPSYSDYLVNTIKSLEHGPEVLYHFANNIEEAQRFVKLGPLAATLALGEINARYKSAEQAPPKPEPKVSKAPTPPPTVKGGKSAKSVTPDTDDLDEFAKLFYAPKRR